MTDRHILNRRDVLASGLAGLGMLASSGGLPGARMAPAPAPSPGRPHPYVDDVGWANVRGFGATGNGVDDDAGPIQRAINSGASLVYFPAGVYRLDSTLDLTDRDDNPITLAGAGTTQTGGQQATTFLGNTGGIVIDTVGSQYVTLRGFRVLSEATSTTRNPSTVGMTAHPEWSWIASQSGRGRRTSTWRVGWRSTRQPFASNRSTAPCRALSMLVDPAASTGLTSHCFPASVSTRRSSKSKGRWCSLTEWVAQFG